MANRREPDRRDRERDDYANKRQATRETQARPKLDEFWLDGDGIDRQVLQSSICRFLGPEATSRPYEYQGKPGFKIKAIRTFTPDMLDDLKSLSTAFRLENNQLRTRNRDEVRYEESETRIRKDLPENYDYGDRERSHHQGGNPYGMQGAYTSEAPVPGYPAMYASSSAPYSNSPYTMAPPSSMPAYSDGRYPPDYGYQPNAREAIPPPGYGYPQGYPDPGRLQTGAGHFQNPGPPVPRGGGMMDDSRDPRDPRYAGYDPMSGIQHGGNPYGVPPRQNQTPYDTMSRDQYSRPPPADPYVSRRR